jgi:hypothetical protein
MKLAGILLIGALPGMAVAYAALTGYLVNRVRPAPIVLVPARGVPEPEGVAEAIAA